MSDMVKGFSLALALVLLAASTPPIEAPNFKQKDFYVHFNITCTGNKEVCRRLMVPVEDATKKNNELLLLRTIIDMLIELGGKM